MSPIIIVYITIVALIVSIFIIARKKNTSKQIRNTFLGLLISLLIWEIGIILRSANKDNIELMYFCEGIAYIGVCFSPVFIFNLARVFVNSKLKYSKKDLLIGVIPIITLIVCFTNNYHHLFYAKYTNEEMVYGSYMYIHSLYTYALLFTGFFWLLRYTIRNSGFFSKASIYICMAITIPTVLSIITFNNIDLYFYIVPSSFFVSTLLLMLALLRFKLLNIAPIALQKILDRISDGYIFVNEDLKIVEYNKTLIELLALKVADLRGKNIGDLTKIFSNLKENDFSYIIEAIKKTKGNDDTEKIQKYFIEIDKYFNIEVNSIFSKEIYIGTLVLFKDITQHIKDQEIMSRQAERNAFNGEARNIAHEIKSPLAGIKRKCF